MKRALLPIACLIVLLLLFVPGVALNRATGRSGAQIREVVGLRTGRASEVKLFLIPCDSRSSGELVFVYREDSNTQPWRIALPTALPCA